jgi:hypothetical protein
MSLGRSLTLKNGGAFQKRKNRIEHDAVGHAAAIAHRRAAGCQHLQHLIAALARLAEAGEPVPCPGFAEYAPEPNPETKKKDVVWFALNDDRPLFTFADVQRGSGHEVEADTWALGRIRSMVF